MCGIAGIFQSYNDYSTSDLINLSKVLRHRGPDDEGFCIWQNDFSPTFFKGQDSPNSIDLSSIETENSFKMAFLHRRLAIQDLSVNGHQPMEKNGYVIIFNGEIYNFKKIRQKLIQKGYSFTSNSDTEVVLTAYIDKQQNCVDDFEGMWALAIYDPNRRAIFLSRDRFGIKPLYTYRHKGVFAFASEIKALTALNGIDKSLNNENIASYLAFGTTQQPYGSLFQHIKDFSPGTNGYFFIDTTITFCYDYFSIKELSPTIYPINKKFNKLAYSKEAFPRRFDISLDLHLISDVEVGSCLSGGLDSSLIVAKTAELNPNQEIKTFTAAYKNPDIDESNYAKMVAGTYENVTPYFTYPTADTFIEDIDKLLYHQDLPIGSTSIFAQWEVMKAAKAQNIKVLLDGQGADEILGGYFNFAGIFLIELLKQGKFKRFFTEYRLLKERFSPAMFQVFVKGLYYYFPEFIQKIIRQQERLSYRFVHSDFHKKLHIPPRGGKTFADHSILAVQWNLYDLLRYEDRNSMAFSIEARVPFLYKPFVETSIFAPSTDKIKDGWTKYPVREIMTTTKLPKEIIWRKGKKGFITPQQEWKTALAKKMKDELLSLDFPEVMNKNYIQKLIDQPIDNTWHLSEFWRAYSVVKWYNIFGK